MASLAGHLWTIAPAFGALLRGRVAAGGEPYRLPVVDPEVGALEVTGRLRRAGDGRRAALLLHGLGGSADSAYLPPLERELNRRGWTTLALNQRGCDRRGGDLHHAGFTADLPRVLASEPLAAAGRVALVGVSLGGHVALRYATEGHDPRVAALATVCAPLDLELGARHLDGTEAWIYRRYLLRSLNEVYREVAARRPLPFPVERVARARTIREWDGLVVAPRFGFASAEDYYARASVAPRLGCLDRPALLVWTRNDPMVPAATVRPALERLPGSARVVWSPRGGHVSFPSGLDLGEPGPRGLVSQLGAWLDRTVA